MSVENLRAEMLALAEEFGRFYDRLCPLYTEWNEHATKFSQLTQGTSRDVSATDNLLQAGDDAWHDWTRATMEVRNRIREFVDGL